MISLILELLQLNQRQLRPLLLLFLAQI